MRNGDTAGYEQTYARSLDDPEGFWEEAAEAVHWGQRWVKVLDDRNPPFYRWFSGARLNTCYNCVDLHVEEGRRKQTAIIYDSPITGDVARITYGELLELVSRFAGVLRGLGVEKGDRVLIYMPMIPQALVAMLASARLGAVHSVVFGGFAASELATRLEDAEPKVVVTASCGIEPSGVIEYKPLVDRAFDLVSEKPQACVVYQRPQATATILPGRDHDWEELMRSAVPAGPVLVEATDPLYILYTSGTTGKPKGVVRDNGGHAVALKWSMKNIYNVGPGEVFWAASDVGWVVGHSYIVYAPLLVGAATVVFEGKPVGTPDPGVFWRVIQEHKVKALFTAPTAMRAIRREDPKGSHLQKYDVSGLRALFLAGERLDSDTFHWASDLLKRPVIDHWWQTETGWAICANCMGLDPLPVKAGSPTKPVPGYDARLLDSTGQPVPPPAEGLLAIRLPLPPGCLTTLWQNDEGFIDSYMREYPGFYVTGDGGYIDEDGYVFVMGRVDDVINVAGHRLSTGRMEEVISQHPDVAECAVVGIADGLKGHVPLGLVVVKLGSTTEPEQLVNEIRSLVRQQIGAVASFREVVLVHRLPKTRSGKILRSTIAKIADKRPFSIPSTIDDPSTLDEIQDVLAARAR
ncbi:MAG: propionyl-CoA synthetase [Actinobacteria bacterium]|nr:propionyl-CoA synthetase [Actinomycetota bacterium]